MPSSSIHPRPLANGHPSATSPKDKLIDKFGRQITYVRLSVTDRCNLRCVYCMPTEHMRFLPREELLTFEEMGRLMSILASLGITKVRITGGEPFIRRDIMAFLHHLKSIDGIQDIHITTNGVLTGRYVEALHSLGIAGINLSLDTLDETRFYQMTRRDNFSEVWKCFQKILESGIPLKINTVLLDGKNTDEIIPISRLARDYPVDVRFIEEMPFNGTSGTPAPITWNYRRIREVLFTEYPEMEPVDTAPNATAMNFHVPGHRGNIGIIAGYSRTFCGTCNRIRINAKGMLQTCLYGPPVLNVKQLLRNGSDDEGIKSAFRRWVGRKYRDGFEAEQHNPRAQVGNESMSIIGG